jgi:hypothetical protein
VRERGNRRAFAAVGGLLAWSAGRAADAVRGLTQTIGALGSASSNGKGRGAETAVTWAIERWVELVERLPGATATEQAMLRVLKRRLEGVEDGRPEAADGDPAGTAPEPADEPAGRIFVTTTVTPSKPLSDRLQEILERSIDQTREQGRRAYFERILERLTPDEARILAALSDGSPFPLIHVGWGSPFGELKRRVQENVSSIGRRAGVMVPELVPRYVAHLRELGLVETGPEDPSLGVQYEIVETDEIARSAMKRIEAEGRTPRVARRTLRIAPLGRTLWEACQPSFGDGASG